MAAFAVTGSTTTLGTFTPLHLAKRALRASGR